MAAGDDARRTVLLGEVVHRPHRVALDLEPGGEGEEIERPLIAVHELGRLARTNLDHLGEMQLIARRVIAEHAIERAENARVRGEQTKVARSREQCTGSARVESGELVAAQRRLAEEGFELGPNGVHQRLGDEALDDDTARSAQCGFDLVDGRVAADPRHFQRTSHTYPRPVSNNGRTLPRYEMSVSCAFTRFSSSRGLNGLSM